LLAAPRQEEDPGVNRVIRTLASAAAPCTTNILVRIVNWVIQ
jgi:hypothetical protein